MTADRAGIVLASRYRNVWRMARAAALPGQMLGSPVNRRYMFATLR
jgi:hypothetical protein